MCIISIFGVMSTLQEAAIDTLGKLSKRVWLKLATDMKTALQKCQTGEWNGDADLGDGKPEDLRELYNGRMHTVTLVMFRNITEPTDTDGCYDRTGETVNR